MSDILNYKYLNKPKIVNTVNTNGEEITVFSRKERLCLDKGIKFVKISYINYDDSVHTKIKPEDIINIPVIRASRKWRKLRNELKMVKNKRRRNRLINKCYLFVIRGLYDETIKFYRNKSFCKKMDIKKDYVRVYLETL